MEKPDRANFSILLKVILGTLTAILIAFLFIDGLFKNAESKLNSQEGRVNVLILGKGGDNHAGGDLTDTLILASISLTEEKASLISIPRDIWIPEIRAKINSAYYWGKEKPEFGGGLAFAKENIQTITDVPINYALILDFSSFKEIIDSLGGVDIDVENSFTDDLYPIEGRENDLCDGDKEYKCRYETVRFEKGVNFMDGNLALKYVRSRNGDNDENTDIAREVRQQKVISAIKSKVLSKEVLFNPFKIFKLWNVVKAYIETDIDFYSAMVLGKKLFKIDGNITSFTIPKEMLINPTISSRYDNQYVFIPRSGNWEEIRQWIKSLL